MPRSLCVYGMKAILQVCTQHEPGHRGLNQTCDASDACLRDTIGSCVRSRQTLPSSVCVSSPVLSRECTQGPTPDPAAPHQGRSRQRGRGQAAQGSGTRPQNHRGAPVRAATPISWQQRPHPQTLPASASTADFVFRQFSLVSHKFIIEADGTISTVKSKQCMSLHDMLLLLKAPSRH